MLTINLLFLVALQHRHHGLVGRLPFFLLVLTMDRKAMCRFGETNFLISNFYAILSIKTNFNPFTFHLDLGT